MQLGENHILLLQDAEVNSKNLWKAPVTRTTLSMSSERTSTVNKPDLWGSLVIAALIKTVICCGQRTALYNKDEHFA